MLHEILYALLGYTGDVIIIQNEQFIVNPSLYSASQGKNGVGFNITQDNLLSLSEVQLINKIAALGYQFKLIKQFTDRFAGMGNQNGGLAHQLAYGKQDLKKIEMNDSQEEEMKDQEDEEGSLLMNGVYIKAFCSGVNEMVGVYKEHILVIEREYLKDRSLTVLSLLQKFGIYFQMFPALLSLMDEIEEQTKRGGEILNALYQKCTSGNPIIKNMFSRILFCCQKVFFHQLNAWIVHGQLIDICEEFFIHKIDHGSGQTSQANQGVKNMQNQTFQNNIMLDIGDQNSKSNLNKTKQSIISTQQNAKQNIGSIIKKAADNFGASDDFFQDLSLNSENEWNIQYTLRISMLPHCYISQSIANKILFIGKAVKVLQSKKTRQEDRIPLEELQAFSQAIIKMSKIQEFNVILFSKIIEEIRECVANRLWHLVVIKADLVSHLQSLKDFFLLAKGEFYQSFLSEARNIMINPPRTSAQDDLNIGPLQSTINKLRLEDNVMMSKFKMMLRSFSFNFKDFRQLNGLIYEGDIKLDQNNQSLYLTSTKNSIKSGSLWHSLKQRIDLGFKTSFSFKFINNLVQNRAGAVNQSIISGSYGETPRGGKNDSKPGQIGGEDQKNQKQVIEAGVAFIIQNEKEVIPWKKKTPISTQDLNQFIAIKFISKVTSNNQNQPAQYGNKLVMNQQKQQVQLAHFVQVIASAETNIGKIRNIIDNNDVNQIKNKTEVILAEKEINSDDIYDQAGFMDNQFNQVYIEYNRSNEELKVSFVEVSQQQQIIVKDPILKMQLKLTDFITLDNGSAFLGFTHETTNLQNKLFIKNWSFTSTSQANSKDMWGGLSLDYQIDWPLHLIFGQDTIEKYNQLFRFLLPIKRVQLELQHAWQDKAKSMNSLSDNKLFRQIMLLRQHMQFLVDNLYSYLQIDVLEALWQQLIKGLQSSTDFEEVCKMHDTYLQKIIEQCFLNQSEVLKTLQDIIYVQLSMCKFLSTLEQDKILTDQKFSERFANLKDKFERHSNQMFTMLNSYKTSSNRSSPQLAQLLLKIDYNNYFSILQEKFEKIVGENIKHKVNYGFAAGNGI